MAKLDGRVALVTGGARGMGEAHARALAAEGAQVVIGDVLEAEGTAVADELGDGARFVELDVTDEGSWRAAVGLAEEAFGPISVLVNNAGVLAVAPIAELAIEEVCDATYSTGSEFCVDGGILAGIHVGD